MLVADEDERLCVNAVHSLKLLGVHAEWCLSAERAMEMISERSHQNNDYHMVLLGQQLSGMNGVEIAQVIRLKYGKDCLALLILSCGFSEMEEEARKIGISGFISKPLFKSVLFEAFKTFAGMSGEEEAETKHKTDKELKGKHILLAEDNELNWEVAKELFSILEIELDWAENGKICVEEFEKSPAGYYDAIIMDVRMPVMDGYEACRAIRRLKREDADIPIIAMTADAFSEDIQKCLECGMNDHLAKPIDIQIVARKLKKYLR